MTAHARVVPGAGRGDPDIMVVFDAGYEPARLAWLLRDLPVQVLGRLGTNRVLRQAPPPRRPGQMGPPMRHGRELKLSDDAACPGPDVHTTTQTSRYGAADARAWHRIVQFEHRRDVQEEAIDLILITHFHGDHFAGLPFLLLDAQFTRRTRPLAAPRPGQPGGD